MEMFIPLPCTPTRSQVWSQGTRSEITRMAPHPPEHDSSKRSFTWTSPKTWEEQLMSLKKPRVALSEDKTGSAIYTWTSDEDFPCWELLEE